jgi:ankyrin repeat protein
MHEAIRFVRSEAVEVLLAFGGDPYSQNADGETPFGIIEDYQDTPAKSKILSLIEGRSECFKSKTAS